SARWIFLNQVEPGLLAPDLAGQLKGSGVRIALLSHGADSSDYLHEARIRSHQPGGHAIDRRDACWLGQQLFAELAMHRAVDVTFVLCETDREHAHWLGAREVIVLPRTLEKAPLNWQPVAGRIGTVSTLVHAPNVEGIVELAAALDGFPGIRLRLVGGPVHAGEQLASRFPAIEYLGPIDDHALTNEASTWCAFVNPIFCQPRGCSTKLAVPLSWGLPIATTRAGARGYIWDENQVPFYDDPRALAAESARLANPDAARAMTPAIAALAQGSPRLSDLAASFRAALA
ncbi:MAG: hypothetical protein NTZ29_16855, partial [Verrucomicrobia bacterium]|nr:hypothetical protein [Verrucomicrobiota bacterium]